MHFPVTFIVKTKSLKNNVMNELKAYIEVRASGMDVIKKRYREAIEEIITINELYQWINELMEDDIDRLIRDIDVYYRLEMNMDAICDE